MFSRVNFESVCEREPPASGSWERLASAYAEPGGARRGVPKLRHLWRARLGSKGTPAGPMVFLPLATLRSSGHAGTRAHPRRERGSECARCLRIGVTTNKHEWTRITIS